MPRPAPHAAAVTHLEGSDEVLARLIARVGPCRLRADRTGTHFRALLRSIVFQQLNGKAAETILGRVEALFPGRAPTPEGLLAATDARLRAAGLSRQKIGYARDLAERVAAGALPLERIARLPDAEALAALTQVKGVGEWTAQIFLLFRLGRPDVLPASDFGIRRAVMLAYGLDDMPAPREVARIGAPWRPHGSVAAWYLWRSLDEEG